MSKNAEERYSRNLLDCVEYLLGTEDPAAEGRYFSGLQRYTAEPSETLAIIRENAYTVLSDYEEHEFGPSLPDELLFLEIEARIRQRELEQLSVSYRETIPTWVLGAVTAAVALGGAFWGERFLSVALLIAGFVVAIYGFSWLSARPKERRAKRVLAEISVAKRAIQRQLTGR
jgi:hypothetical protein